MEPVIVALPAFIETDRLILRPIQAKDAAPFFVMDSDPEVHRYLGNEPVTDIDKIREVIAMLQKQYLDFGIGRWAVVLKETNAFIGWSGLKWMVEPTHGQVHYYDFGYRFQKQHWGKGYATEAGKAWMDVGFNAMGLIEIFAMAETENSASCRVLEKCGLHFVEKFNLDNIEHNWYSL